MNDELLEAIRTNDINRVRELIAAGADVNFRKQTILGPTPLIYAARRKNENILHLLIDSGADINGVDRIGRSALHDSDDENIVRILIDAGIDLNIRDNDGETALMIASFYGYLSIVNMLIEGGANIYIKNKDGKNVVELVNELYRNEERMNLREELYPGYKERMKSIMKILQKAENKAKKRIAIDAYMRSRDKPYLPPNAENPLSGFYHSKIDEPDYIMEKVFNMAYGEDEKENENEGAEESKRSDSGGRRKKLRRKSKSKKRKSGGRKKSVAKKKKSRSRKSGVRKKKSRSKRRKSVRK